MFKKILIPKTDVNVAKWYDSEEIEDMTLLGTMYYAALEQDGYGMTEKREKRQVASRAMLDAFWTWVDETATTPMTNEKLTKALNYTLNHKKQLETFLEDG